MRIPRHWFELLDPTTSNGRVVEIARGMRQSLSLLPEVPPDWPPRWRPKNYARHFDRTFNRPPLLRTRAQDILAAHMSRFLSAREIFFLDDRDPSRPLLSLYVTISPSTRMTKLRDTLHNAGLPREVRVRVLPNGPTVNDRRLRRRFNTSWRRCIGCAPPPIFEPGTCAYRYSLPLGGSTIEHFLILMKWHFIALPLPRREELAAYLRSYDHRIREWAYEQMGTMRLR